MKMHTATHVLAGVARKTIGRHIWQAGAQKSARSSRLDLTHYERFTPEELERIEKEANSIIRKGLIVTTRFYQRKEAEGRYGFVLYQGGASPGREVRVVSVKGLDVEACGGTHLANTKEIGQFRIIKAERIQDGINRIVFTTSDSAEEFTGKERRIFEDSVTQLSSISRNAKAIVKPENISASILMAGGVLSVEPRILPATIEKFGAEIKENQKRIDRLSEELGLESRPEDPLPKKPGELADAVEALFNFWKAQKKEIERMVDQKARKQAGQLISKAKDNRVFEMVSADRRELIEMAGGLMNRDPKLTVILANTDMIERGLHPDQEELSDDLADLRRAAQRGSDMVRKLLGYSRRGMIALKPLNVATVIADLLPTLRRILPESIDVRFVPRATEAVVMADEGALEQILFNLATNARDAMPEGGVLRIEVSDVLVDSDLKALQGWGAEGGEYVLLCVGDTGHGMDEGTKERIFDPFFTTKPPGLGTGLGMAMIYGLVKQQDGFIEIESALGQGTSVALYFPLAAETTTRDAAAAAVAASSDGTETILLVEDEAAIRRAAKRLLEKKGYTVLLAGDGVEALDVFERHDSNIDLVITDVVMPRLGGRQLYESLRQRGPEIRFLFTSGYTARDMRDTESLDPAWPFLQKPWNVDELLQHVREILDAERPTAEA